MELSGQYHIPGRFTREKDFRRFQEGLMMMMMMMTIIIIIMTIYLKVGQWVKSTVILRSPLLNRYIQ